LRLAAFGAARYGGAAFAKEMDAIVKSFKLIEAK